MDILPNEVESVKTIGSLFGSDVKLVKTHGGYHIAIGKKKKKDSKSEALAAGSHEGIVAHQIAKEFGSDFEPALAKSENEALQKVEDKTQYLPREAISKGVELYTLSKNNHLEFILYRHGMTMGKYQAEAVGDILVIKKHEFSDMVKAEKKTAQAISRAMEDKMYEMGLKKVKKS